MWATWGGDGECFQLLLQAGTLVAQARVDVEAAASVARGQGRVGFADWIESLELSGREAGRWPNWWRAWMPKKHRAGFDGLRVGLVWLGLVWLGRAGRCMMAGCR